MGELRSPVAPQLAAASFDLELVRSSEELVVDELAGVDVAEIRACLPRAVDVDRAAEEIVLAQPERMEMGSLSRDAKAEDDRHFVHGRNADYHPAGAVGVSQHRCVSEEWLHAQNTLRFRASHLGASVSDAKRQVALNHGF